MRAVVSAVFGTAVFLASSVQALDLNKSFTPTTRQPTQITRVKIDFLNSVAAEATDVALTDTLPAGVFVATPANATSSCGGTVATSNSATEGVIELTGATVPPRVGSVPGSCFVEVDVFAARKGTFVNQIPSGSLTGTQGGGPVTNADPASATLLVLLQDLTGTLDLGIGGNVVQGGETSSRTITLNNPNDVALTGVAFTHDLSADQGANLTASGPVGGTCGGVTTITPTPSGNAQFGNTSVIDVSDAIIPANASCTITYDVTPSRDATLPFNNTQLNHRIGASAITTNEGATNFEAFQDPIRTVTGTRVTKTFDGSNDATLNTNTASGSDLSILIENFNGASIDDFDLTDVLPAGLVATNIFRNTCGGTTNTGTSGGDVAVVGGNLGPVAGPLAGLQTRSCTVDARIEPTSTANATYTNEIPAGDLSGFQFASTSATLDVTDFIAPENPLIVTKAFQRGNIFPGESQRLTFTFTNNYDENIRNIDLTDDLIADMTAGSGVRIGGRGLVSRTCDGRVRAVPNETVINIDDVTLDIGTQCTVVVEVTQASNVATNRTIDNTVPTSSVTFDLVDGTGLTVQDAPSDSLQVRRPIEMAKSYTPATVVAGGDTRLRLTFTRFSRDGALTSDITFTDTLPAGHAISATPNLLNTCGGSVSLSGGNTISLSNGALGPVQGNSSSCSVFVDVVAPNSIGSASNVIPAGDASATDNGQPNGLNAMVTTNAASATLTRGSSAITINKEFLTTTIQALEPSRVRITFDNGASGAADLTGLSVTDVLAAPLELAADIDPAFTDTSGQPNANGCRGGRFSTVPGAGGSITLTGGTIDAGARCYFEFNSTSRTGGTYPNVIDAGDVTTDQGATNTTAVTASLAIDRKLNISKGFVPPVVEPGQSALLTVLIRNDQPAGFTGQALSLRDEMPAGVALVPGSAATSCADATASINGSDLELAGGTFPPETTCEVTASVTANAAGTYINVIPIGALQMNEPGSNEVQARATLRSVLPPTITKSFSNPSISSGAVSTVQLTLTNPNDDTVLPAGMTGASFSDTLTDMVVASPPNVGGSCNDLRFATEAGGSQFDAFGITLLPSASCTVSFDVNSTVEGTHDNATTGVTTDQTATPGAPSNSVDLTVSAPVDVTITKSLTEAVVKTGQPAQITFLLENPNAAAADIASPGFTDIFPTAPGNMVLAADPGAFNSCLGTVTDQNGVPLGAGDTGVALQGGQVPAGGSCFVTVNVEMDAEGSYTNTASGLTTTIGARAPATSSDSSDTITVNDVLPMASSSEADRTVTFSNNDFFVNSILGPGDTVGDERASVGPNSAENVTLRIVNILDAANTDASALVQVDPNGVIVVRGNTPDDTYRISYEICQVDQSTNCAPTRTERVIVRSSDIVATTDFEAATPLVVQQADFAQEPGNVIGANDTLDGEQASVAPGTGGNVDLSILSIEGASGPTSDLSVNVNTGVISVGSGTPAGDYTITYRITEDDNAGNFAEATETVRVRITPITADAEAPRVLVGRDAPQGAGNLLGSGDTLDGAQATVGAGAAGNVDLSIVSVTAPGVSDPASRVAVDTDTGEITMTGGAPDGTYSITYRIREEANRGNFAEATEQVTITSNSVAAGPEPTRAVTGSDGAIDAGNALSSANDRVNGAPATVGSGGNAVLEVVAGANTDFDLSLNVVTGAITVAPGTPAGTYTLEYRLSEAINTDNSATAIETVTITDTPIAAAPEAQREVFQANEDGTAGSALAAGDTFDGNPAVPGFGGNVRLSLVSSTGGLSLDTETSDIIVPGDTPVGLYEITYRICDPTNLDNCADATETVNVTRRPIVAAAEADRDVTGDDDTIAAGSVIGAGDQLDSAQATVGTTGNTVLSVVSIDTELTLNTATGALEVVAGTAAGTYRVTYRLSEAANSANSAQATETVIVTDTSVTADAEPVRVVAQRDTDAPAGFVLAGGDTIGGAQADAGNNVILSLVSADTALTLNTATGAITVAADTPAGTYDLRYRICDPDNTDNCAEATEQVRVEINTIQAQQEAPFNVIGNDADQIAGNAIGPNDLLLGAQATIGPGGNVVLSTVTGPNTAPELTLDPDTGEITVQGTTSNGSYALEYRICEVGNASNCAQAIETVTVASTAILAGPEPVREITGSDNAVAAGNVLDPGNDTLEGNPATAGTGGNVVLSVVTGPFTSPGLTLDTETGALSVDPGVVAGTYFLRYRICEAANTDNCATANETVEITDTPIAAGAEPDRQLRSADTAQQAGSVLDAVNDVLDTTIAASPGSGGNVVLSTVAGPGTSTALSMDPDTGVLTLAADAPPGNYTLRYRICEVGNTDNCAEATETVRVTLTPLSAAGATFGPIDTAVGGTTDSVLLDDLLDGTQPTVGSGGTVVMTIVTPASDPGVTLDTDTGRITSVAGVTQGTYTITYEVCEAANLDNCAQATESVVVTAINAFAETFPPIETNGGTTASMLASDMVGGQPATLATVTIEVVAQEDGLTLDTATGLITLAPDRPAGDYQVTYRICSVATPTACDQATETVNQLPLPAIETTKTFRMIDNGDGVNGVGDWVVYEMTVENRGNVPLEDVSLADAFSDMRGRSLDLDDGPDFDGATNGSPEGELAMGETARYEARYLLTVESVSAGGVRNVATSSAQARFGLGVLGTPGRIEDVSDDGDDSDGNSVDDPTILSIEATLAPTGLRVTKTTPRGKVERGSIVPYTIAIQNDNPVVSGQLDIVDTLPAGFRYLPRSARLDGIEVSPEVQGRVITFSDVPIPPLTTVTLTLSATITTGVQPGEHVNEAALRNPETGALLAPTDTATVRILPEPVFDCGDVIGRVFEDLDRDGYQDAGEPGLPAVRIAGVEGTIITTDEYGRFHLPCAVLPERSGTNFILKVDTRSLPSGYRITTENPRVMRLTRGKMSEINFGAALTRIVRIDLSAKAFSREGDALALSPPLVSGLDLLVDRIAREPSVIRLSYSLPPGAQPASVQTARRLNALVERHLRDRWRGRGHYDLVVERTYVAGR